MGKPNETKGQKPTAVEAGELQGKPSRYKHAAIRRYRRFKPRFAKRIEIVHDILVVPTKRNLESLARLREEHAPGSLRGVFDLDGDNTGWAVALQIEVQGGRFVTREVRIFPAMPEGVDLDDHPIGAAPMPCGACGQLMPQGPTPKGGITDAVFRAGKPMHYRKRILDLLDEDTRAVFAGPRGSARLRERSQRRSRSQTPQQRLDIVLRVNQAWEHGSARANADVAEQLGEKVEWVTGQLKHAVTDEIIEPVGKGQKGPRTLTAYGKQLLEERNRTT